MLVPLGHDQGIRSTPWLTAAVLVLWALMDLVRVVRLPSENQQQEAEFAQARAEAVVLRRLTGEPSLAPESTLRQQAWEIIERGHAADEQALLDRLRENRSAVTGQQLRGMLDQLAAADAQRVRLARRDVAVQLAFRPADGVTARLLMYAVVHAGWLHLIISGLFLWVVGCNLEDRWGRGVTGGLLVGGALAGAAAHAVAYAGTDAGLVGGSVPVAAAMGAFTVCFGNARLRLGYLNPFRRPMVGRFTTRAGAILPAWFLGQLASIWVAHSRGEATGTVAHAASFGFGALLAIGLRTSGIERRHLLPAAARRSEWNEAPEFIAAMDLLRDERPGDAVKVLAAFAERHPQHGAARERLAELALQLGRRDLVLDHISEALLKRAQDDRPDEVVRLYRALVAAMPDVIPGDRALLEVTRSALGTGARDLAGDVALRLAECHPRSALAPGALWMAARGCRRREVGARLCQALIAQFPEDPLADAARRHEQARESRRRP